MPYDPTKQTFMRGQMPVELDSLPAANYRRDPAQQFIFPNGWILPSKSVSLRDQRNVPALFSPVDEAMRAESTISEKEHNVPTASPSGSLRLND